MGHPFFGTEHLLLGILGNGQGTATEALLRYGVTWDLARQAAQDKIGYHEPVGSPNFTFGAKKALELSLRESLQLGDKRIMTGHLLLGLLREAEGQSDQILDHLGADTVALRATMLELGFDERFPAFRSEPTHRSTPRDAPTPEG